MFYQKQKAMTATINYNQILTSEVIAHINKSVVAAKAGRTDCVCIDSDRIISNFSDKLTTEQYKSFNWDLAEDFLFGYAENKFAQA